MTNEQILEKAIEKAMKNGFKGTFPECKTGIACEAQSLESDGDCVYTTIFSHDFAKAFWKKEMAHYKLTCNVCGNSFNFIDEFYNPKYCSDCGNKLKKIIEYKTDAWQYHLQQMVLEKEPLKYIEKFL